ncbi:hypothetical protein [Pseudoxanthomonas mexicana]|jgi:hypothetical protein|uniref:hypothetical protein n=1 Tax=Pseudoxanthomonas mexicana TaxID=128785 RepID=UPI00078073B0|nr:hypothetical protein [Pseudoxanthomonas mexicana]
MRRWRLLCLLASASFARASEPATFAGHYGHGATHDADEVVWTVEALGGHWRIVRTADGEAHDAHRLQARGREAFWTRMGWPADSSADADCMSWGQKPASLDDLLADTPPAAAAAGEDYGLGVLCRVPLAARIKTGWLGGQASDWFYYDPIAGVMELKRLR